MPTRDLVVIGASAGGLPALYAILGSLPPTLPAAVVVVVHTRSAGGVLPQVLGRRSALPVDGAADGAGLEPGRVYVAPADRHVLVGEKGLRVVRWSARERVPPRRRSPLPHRGPIARAWCHRRHPLGRARRRRLRVERDRPPRRDRHRAGSRRCGSAQHAAGGAATDAGARRRSLQPDRRRDRAVLPRAAGQDQRRSTAELRPDPRLGQRACTGSARYRPGRGRLACRPPGTHGEEDEEEGPSRRPAP